MKAAFIFSGQGAQRVGMGKDIYDSSAAGRAVYQEADSLLPWSVSDVCFNGPEDKLTESRYCQVAIFVTSMACLAAFREKFGSSVEAVGAAGLSLGEYGALCCAGAFRFADGLRLVARRAELMDAACRETHGAMACVLTKGAAPADTIRDICAGCGIDVANYNAPGQIVISGVAEGVEKASEQIKTLEGIRKIVPLKVAGAYHSRLMAKAGEQLRTVLDGIEIKPSSVPVAQNVTGKVTEDPAQIKANLVSQVAGSVRWVDCVNALSAIGADTFIEFGPGTVLTGLVKQIDGTKALFNVSSCEDLAKIQL